MKLKRIGFFPELSTSPSEATSLKNAVRDTGSADESKIVTYLGSGVVFIARPGIERDVLDDEHPIIGSGHLRTDGIWLWPEVLSHYVSTYHVRLRDEFVEHLRAMSWKLPAGIDLRSLSI
jgi:hypothetical protein